MPRSLRAIGVSGYLTVDAYFCGATFRMSAPFRESRPVVPRYSITPLPATGAYIFAKLSSTFMRWVRSWMVGKKPYFSRGPATQATGTPGATRARNRLGPKLTTVTTFSFLGSYSRASWLNLHGVENFLSSQE